MARPTVIAGNWKMHHGPRETREFFAEFRPEVGEGGGPEILVFPPSISVVAALECPDRGEVGIGVQNVHWEDRGAFTGEVSAGMVAGTGATHVLVGHSERRHVFGETDVEVARKVAAVLRHDLVSVVCVGETLDQRTAGRVDEIILGQLDAALEGVDDASSPFVLAYEPVWAIGTGETATPRDASEAHGTLRGHLAAVLGTERAEDIPVLYGGSVKPHNAAELLDAPDVDGVLVGGASLDPGPFARIVEAGAR
ncbi:MAG: triose-phosphate isomerase [Gemmatimonadota bacterium]|jgi:triosephosphate isomerase